MDMNEHCALQSMISIEELGEVIAWHLRHYNVRTNQLPREASVLIDVYGSMSYRRQHVIEMRMLDDEQALLVQQALTAKRQLPLPTLAQSGSAVVKDGGTNTRREHEKLA
jgi:hypothetical protein